MPEEITGRKRARVTVRLYRRHDLGLIALYLTDGFKFQKEMAACARAEAEGKRHEVRVPPGGARPRKGYVRRHYTLSLSFGRAGDGDVLDLLAGIKPGMRCPYLKALMRSCIRDPGESLPAYEEGNGIYVSEDAARAAGERTEPEPKHRMRPTARQDAPGTAQAAPPEDLPWNIGKPAGGARDATEGAMDAASSIPKAPAMAQGAEDAAPASQKDAQATQDAQSLQGVSAPPPGLGAEAAGGGDASVDALLAKFGALN